MVDDDDGNDKSNTSSGVITFNFSEGIGLTSL